MMNAGGSAGERVGEGSASGPVRPVYQCVILFDNQGQQDAWLGFVRRLKERYPDIPTLGARLSEFIEDIWGRDDP